MTGVENVNLSVRYVLAVAFRLAEIERMAEHFAKEMGDAGSKQPCRNSEAARAGA
jgi:hypothetical protein